MIGNGSGLSGAGLERSCEPRSSDWLRWTDAVGGVALLEAWFGGAAYRPHRHDTYAIGLTDTGVQAFAYRGATHVSTPGDVVVLHPDEPHDGYAGSDAGFGYRLLYVEPALIFGAVRELPGGAGALPFVPEPVVPDATLAGAIRMAFAAPREELATDEVVLRLAQGLLAAAPGSRRAPPPRHLDVAAAERARAFLEAERTRVVRSWELEAVSGHTRHELARHFRALLGTSPYRYLVMRRLDAARALLVAGRPLVETALETGFADQAHFTRVFTAAYGIAPGRYRALDASPGSDPGIAPWIPSPCGY